MTSVNYTGLSFIGKRKENQDNYCILKIDDNTYYIAVADGMGGQKGGELASSLTIYIAQEYLKTQFESPVQISELKNILRQINHLAQETIANEIKKQPELHGMGTTLSSMIIHDGFYACSNIGDSRIYLLKDDIIEQISFDHTYISEYFAAHGGKIDSNIIEQYSHIITRSIDGGNNESDIFLSESKLDLNNGTIFLLCSDGLITDKINTNTNIFKNYIKGSSILEESAKNLISNAFYNGSADNITVVLLEYGNYPRKKLKLKQLPFPPDENLDPYSYQKHPKKIRKWPLILGIVLLVVSVIIILELLNISALAKIIKFINKFLPF